ncbi:MAG: beta strand repeat-containing protein, partial [Limisphaerales bacterium]
GGGVETLTGANTYSGSTIINGGTLALSDSGSIANSTNIQVMDGASLDVSGANSEFTTTYPVVLESSGTMIGNASVGPLLMSNAALTLDVDPSKVNATANSLTVAGDSNVVNIASVSGVPGYPAQFTVVQYSGSLTGADNFVIGAVPNASTGGYISNDVTDSRIVLVLTNGPASLTWTGSDPANPTYWDLGVTTNWLAFKGTANEASSTFDQADSTFFDDTAASSLVDIRTNNLQPGFVTVSNNILNYTFTGSGLLSGSMSLVKNGSGTLTLLNSGGDSYKGGVAVDGGAVVFGANNSISGGVTIANSASVQVGTNGGTGTLPAGNVDDEGSVAFDRGANLTVANAFSGAGTITEEDANVLTLSGDSSAFTGPINVTSGTLKAGSGTALGTADNATTISDGATLDVNGQTLTTEPVIVSGAGVGGLGAIINSGADNINALGNVTLAGNTTFGGTGRWDIRGGAGTLSTSGQPYTLTKIGTNQVSLVGVNVDGSLGDINVQSGLLSIETTTSGLGNSGNTLTVASGATLQFYNSTASFNKQFSLHGDGINTTLNAGAGAGNTISGPITLNGNCIFSAASGSALTFSGTIGGTGSLLKTGAGTNILASGASASVSGGTTVSNGTLVVDGSWTGSVKIVSGAMLAGNGTISGAVTVPGGAFSPGDIAGTPQGTLTVGDLTMSNATGMFEMDTTPASSSNDKLAAGSLTLNGTNTLQITPLSFMNIGDTYTLITYGGATLTSNATNQLKIVSSKPFFTFSIIDPATTPGSIQIKVLTAVGNDTWTGANSFTWDTSAVNWNRNGNPVAFNNGDTVTFDDSSTVTNVSLSGALTVSGITEQSSGEAYTLGGAGSLTGSGGLDFEGASLTIANSGTNTFTGPIYIANGTLQLGNGSTNGNLGSGVVTNNGTLVFDRSDNALTLSNNISGYGSVSNIGTGTVTLAGANTGISGTIVVASGTLRTLNSDALGDPATGATSTYVNTNATLDIGANTVELGNDAIYVAGAGVGGNGAIINSSGSTSYGGAGGNFYNVTMLGDTTIGGTGRMDMRNGTATPILNANGNPYTLTKVGTNDFHMVNVQVDPALGDINVMGGSFGIQGSFPFGLGDSSHNITVFNGGDFDLYDLVAGVTKNLILEDGGTVSGSHGASVFSGPVTLQGGTNIFNVTSGSLAFMDVLSGPGNLDKTGGSTLIFSNVSETYTGNTYVDGGTLALAGDATLSGTPAIFLGGNTLDVSDRSDAMLTLVNQALTGGGAILGAVVEDSGSTISPGGSVTTATLNDDTAFTLNGKVVMDLNRTNNLQNDKLVAPSFVGGGTLTVTNLGPDLVTGDTFQLFSTNVTGLTVNLPVKNAAGTITYSWENDIATLGSIKVLNGAIGVNTTPTNIVATVSGGNLMLSWPADHTGWTLQVQTNSLSVGISTNWVDVPGSATVDSMTVPIGTANGTVFYRMIYRP